MALLGAIPAIFYTAIYKDDRIELQNLSKQVVSQTGFDDAELLHADNYLRTLIHPEDYDRVTKIYRTIPFSVQETIEYKMNTRSGQIRYVQETLISYQTDGGKTIEGYITEVGIPTSRSRLFNQLRAYRNAIDVNIISSITDTTGKIIYVNQNFCNVSKYAMHELIGQNHRIICSGHHPPEFFEGLWQTISSGKQWHGEIMNKAKDGTIYWVDTVIIPIFDDNNRIENYLSLRTLITGKKTEQFRLASYTSMLEQIAFMVAHRIRGPLCSILGLANILENPDLESEDIKKSLSFLKSSATELNDLTQELSKFVFENEIELRVRDFTEKIKTRQ